MICRKCRAQRQETARQAQPRRGRNRRPRRQALTMAVGGQAAAISPEIESGFGPDQAEEAEPQTVIAECGHLSVEGTERFCEECSAEHWCCGECGQPLERADLRPSFR